jgi:hypothetical protein
MRLPASSSARSGGRPGGPQATKRCPTTAPIAATRQPTAHRPGLGPGHTFLLLLLGLAGGRRRRGSQLRRLVCCIHRQQLVLCAGARAGRGAPAGRAAAPYLAPSLQLAAGCRAAAQAGMPPHGRERLQAAQVHHGTHGWQQPGCQLTPPPQTAPASAPAPQPPPTMELGVAGVGQRLERVPEGGQLRVAVQARVDCADQRGVQGGPGALAAQRRCHLQLGHRGTGLEQLDGRGLLQVLRRKEDQAGWGGMWRWPERGKG